MTKSALTAVLLFATVACQAEHAEQAKQAYDKSVDAAKEGYDKGVDAAKEGYGKGVDAAKEGYDKGVDAAKDGYDAAKEGIADAREHYEVDERLAEARERFSTGMDDAADSFAELAAAGSQGAKDIGAAIDEKGKAGIDGAAEAIDCKPDPDKPEAMRCKIADDLLEKLKNEPKQLAKQIMLLPKQGATGAGLELVRVKSKSIPELLGLNRNDILLELNGTSLGSLDAIRNVDEAMAGKPNAEIVYERDGERKTLVLERE